MVVRPSVPAPITATVMPGSMRAARAAWTAQAVGSTITASSSSRWSGTTCSWLGWATSPPADQPPPVSEQKPICRPGDTCPNATRSHPPVSPTAQAGHNGLTARATQPSTASTTTRVPMAGPPSVPPSSVPPSSVPPPSVPPPSPAAPAALDSVTVLHHLVAGDEGEAHQILEVARAATVEGGQVRTADAGQPGSDPHPLRPGPFGGIEIGQAQRAQTGPPPGTGHRRGQARHREAGQVALEDEGLHRRRPPLSPPRPRWR